MSANNPLDPQVPPVGEEIHLPGPTVLPLLLTVGVTLVLIGAIESLVLVIGGGILVAFAMIKWIVDTKRDIAELPLEHEHPH